MNRNTIASVWILAVAIMVGRSWAPDPLVAAYTEPTSAPDAADQSFRIDTPNARATLQDKQLTIRLTTFPSGGRVTFPRLNNVVVSARILGDPTTGQLRITQTPQVWTIHLPEQAQVPATVEVEFANTAAWHPPSAPFVANADGDGAIVLSARHAIVHGDKLQFEPQIHKKHRGLLGRRERVGGMALQRSRGR